MFHVGLDWAGSSNLWNNQRKIDLQQIYIIHALFYSSYVYRMKVAKMIVIGLIWHIHM